MREPTAVCHPECDDPDYDMQHHEDCPWVAAQTKYWAWYFGQDKGNKADRKRILEAMDPCAGWEERARKREEDL